MVEIVKMILFLFHKEDKNIWLVLFQLHYTLMPRFYSTSAVCPPLSPSPPHSPHCLPLGRGMAGAGKQEQEANTLGLRH